MKPSLKKRSSNSSDSDDWTLLSAPHSSGSSSSSSSSEPRVTFEENLSKGSSCSSSAPIQSNHNDGLTEIDLNNESASFSAAATSQRGRDCDSDHHEKRSSPISGFTALDTTDDEDISSQESHQSSASSRKSSLSGSELGEFVDFSRNLDLIGSNIEAISPIKPRETIECMRSPSLERSRGGIEAVCDRLKKKINEREEPAREFDDTQETTEAHRLQIDSGLTSSSSESVHRDIVQPHVTRLSVVVLIVALLHYYGHRGKSSEDAQSSGSMLKEPSFTGRILPELQLNELRLLHDELSQCIKRQSPTSFKYYMSENQFKKQQSSDSNSKPYRGLVCYGQESQWRERFDRLKSDFNLDLNSLVQETKRNLTNTLLQSKHPMLQFTLILDQLEYLQFLEIKRNKKQTEETIKHLKAENLQLLRRLNQPNENSYQKLVVSLELKNSRLQRENEALKANLMEKAGTVYMKQSMELEQYERENIMLKQFYHQVAKDVSKSLKQFNLHAMDATQSLGDHEILNSQLMLTRGYLRKLGEKISTVLLENESLKEELRETYLKAVLDKDTNLQASTSGQNSDSLSAIGIRGNESNALIADSCMRNLIESRRKTKELEQEVSVLKSKCSGCNSVDLEKVNYYERRQLNRSDEYHSNDELRAARQLPDSSSSTAMDKRYRDSLYLANEEIVDGLMTFLTKFNHQVESKNFPIIESPYQEGLVVASNGVVESETPLTIDRRRHLTTTDDASEMKMIPNYIREETRSRLSGKTSDPSGQSNSDVGLPISFGVELLFNSTADQPISATVSEAGLSEQQPENELAAQEADAQLVSPSEMEKNTGDEKSTSDPVLGEKSNTASWVRRVVNDSWFFKRAKQRRHLRGHHNDRKDLHGRHANWAIKRAKLREKLREKLRKAWLYIENTFETTSCKHNKHSDVHQNHNHPLGGEKLHHTCGNNGNQQQQFKGQTHRTDYYSKQQRRSKSDNLRDEL